MTAFKLIFFEDSLNHYINGGQHYCQTASQKRGAERNLFLNPEEFKTYIKELKYFHLYVYSTNNGTKTVEDGIQKMIATATAKNVLANVYLEDIKIMKAGVQIGYITPV